MSLTIGRVGLDVDIGEPASWSETQTLDGGRRVNIRGWLQNTTLASAQALRTELLEQQGKLVACTYSRDTTFDAYFYLSDVRIESVEVSYSRRIFRFEVELVRAGSDSRIELQSLVTGAAITNSHALAGTLWHATPPGALAYDAGTTTPTEHSRASEDGVMAVYLDVDPDQDPTWSAPPSTFYDSAVEVVTQDRLRAGQDVISDPTNWQLSNGIVRVRPVTYQAASNGRFDFFFHDGTVWSQAIRFKIVFGNSVDVPKWHYVTIVRNDPELATVRIVRDAETSPPSAYKHVLDFTLRRGAPFVSCHYSFKSPNADDHAVARDSADPATSGTGHIRDSSTIDGHRWVLGSPRAFTNDLTNGKISLTTPATTLPFFIGAAILDAADASGDGPGDITNQYIGQMGETVRAVRR